MSLQGFALGLYPFLDPSVRREVVHPLCLGLEVELPGHLRLPAVVPVHEVDHLVHALLALAREVAVLLLLGLEQAGVDLGLEDDAIAVGKELSKC